MEASEESMGMITNLAPTLFASPSMFRVPITFVLMVCSGQYRHFNTMNCQEKLRNDSASHRTYLNGIVLVEDWGSRAGKVVDLINLHKQRLGDI
jgi:hypothetical protein